MEFNFGSYSPKVSNKSLTWIRTNSVNDWKISIKDISYGDMKIYE